MTDPARHPVISVIQFARAIQTAQVLISRDGLSSHVAVHRALQEVRADGCWALPLVAVINDSPILAEGWAWRQLDLAFDRMQARLVETTPVVEYEGPSECLACGEDCHGRCDAEYESSREPD